MSEDLLPLPVRLIASGVIALGVHAGLVLALPAQPHSTHHEQEHPALVWLDAGQPDLGLEPEGGAVTVANPVLPPAARPVQRFRAKATRATGNCSGSSVDRAARPSADENSEASASSSAEPARVSGAVATETNGGLEGAAQTASPPPGGGGAGHGGGLAHGPILRKGRHCSAYFPAGAHAERGLVELDVSVDESGHARVSTVLHETPVNEGFAGAARSCLHELSFSPAVDPSGAPVAGHAKLRLRFARASTT